MIVKTVSANFAIMAITFATSVLTARILGPVGRGELALVLLYPQLVAGITLMGVDRAVAVLSGRGELARPVASIVKLVLLLTIPAMAAGYIALHWRLTDPHLAGLSTLYLAYVPAVYFFMLVVFLFNGTGDFARFNLVRLGFYVANLILLISIWAAAPSASLDWVVMANLAAVYGGLALTIWLLRGFQRSGGVGIVAASHTSDVGRTLRLALVFAIPAALAQFSISAYQIVLEHHMGAGPLGLFVVYYSYSRLFSPVGSAIGSHLFHLGIAGGNRDIALTFRRSLIVYFGCSLPLWLIAAWLIPLLFGRGFLVNSWVVGLLFVSGPFALSSATLAEFLNGRQKVGANTGGLVIYLAALGVLGWWLVPQFGLVGMALAMLVADILRCVYIVIQAGRDTAQHIGEFLRVTWADLDALAVAGKMAVLGLRAWR